MEKQNLQKGSSGIQTVGSVLKVIGSWIYRLRKVLMAIPVILAALYLARYNRRTFLHRWGLICRLPACTPR